MPNIRDMKDSKFLKRTDCNPPILVTIENVEQENVAKEGAPQELKWCVKFSEHEKPMVLNSTNAQLIAGICGSEETEQWAGKKVVLYDDPSISYQGKLVGGIRVRAPRQKAAVAVVPAPAKPAAKAAPLPPEDPGPDDDQPPF